MRSSSLASNKRDPSSKMGEASVTCREISPGRSLSRGLFVVHSTDGSIRRSMENRAQADDALPVSTRRSVAADLSQLSSLDVICRTERGESNLILP
jgi:hypothetical protein